jgi:predicted transcriptional regulator
MQLMMSSKKYFATMKQASSSNQLHILNLVMTSMDHLKQKTWMCYNISSIAKCLNTTMEQISTSFSIITLKKDNWSSHKASLTTSIQVQIKLQDT